MTILIADTFTAADNTAINGRTPDTTVSSRTWSTGNLSSTGAPTGAVDIQNNKVRMNIANDGFAIDCSASDYTVTHYNTTPASGVYRGGCRFRIQNSVPFSTTNDRDFYFMAIRFDLTTATIRFVKQVNGTETGIGTDTDYTFSANTTYKITLSISGTTYKVYVDDVLVKTETDSTYTGGTWIGFGAGAVSGNDFTFDSVQVDIGAPIPVFMNQYRQRR